MTYLWMTTKKKTEEEKQAYQVSLSSSNTDSSSDSSACGNNDHDGDGDDDEWKDMKASHVATTPTSTTHQASRPSTTPGRFGPIFPKTLLWKVRAVTLQILRLSIC